MTQDGAGNLVVTVRINSPGNNGPVSQTNAAIGSAKEGRDRAGRIEPGASLAVTSCTLASWRVPEVIGEQAGCGMTGSPGPRVKPRLDRPIWSVKT